MSTDGDRPIRIMLVDDHEILLESLVRLFESDARFEVVGVATTLVTAVETAAAARPAIVVMDYLLPDGTGTDAAQAIIERQAGVKIILLTGSQPEIAEFEAARAGCYAYLEKTSAIGTLTTLIERVYAAPAPLIDVHNTRLPPVDELVVHYQPIVDLATTAPVGFEALVRWQHPVRGLIPPLEFLGLAEQTSLILDIGDRVRRIACAQAAEWARRHDSGFMGVNVSGRELALADLVDRLDVVLSETRLDPNRLVVEVTETYLVHDIERGVRVLDSIRALGARVALDDFGAGYSSLDYLRRFPIDIIKLDKAFTDELPNGDRALRLVEAVGHLADDLGISAEAEGIETEDQVQCLRDLGWSLGQGYLFSRPVDARAAEKLLRD